VNNSVIKHLTKTTQYEVFSILYSH